MKGKWSCLISLSLVGRKPITNHPQPWRMNERRGSKQFTKSTLHFTLFLCCSIKERNAVGYGRRPSSAPPFHSNNSSIVFVSAGLLLLCWFIKRRRAEQMRERVRMELKKIGDEPITPNKWNDMNSIPSHKDNTTLARQSIINESTN